jgi:hypothetical protein
VEEFLGRYLSTPKANVVFKGSLGASPPLSRCEVILDARTQFLYLNSRFFINGEVLRPRASQRQALAALADLRRAPGRALARAGLGRLILEWRRSGYLSLEPGP